MTACNTQPIEVCASAEIYNELDSTKKERECCVGLTSSSQNKEHHFPTSIIPEESTAGDVSIAAVKKKERRSSVASNTSVHDDSNAKGRSNSRRSNSAKKGYVMRKLSEPMHRSRSSNELSSIIRPSRYSFDNLAGLDAAGERRTPCSDLDTTELQNAIPMGENLLRTASAAIVNREVEFSTSAEVYVFKK